MYKILFIAATFVTATKVLYVIASSKHIGGQFLTTSKKT